MKKIYIKPTVEKFNIEVKHGILLEGSLHISGDSGTATFFDDNAETDAMVKEDRDGFWDDEW
ncbi:MAG: hypothetical protein IJQ44_07485 [Bacteroidaceae bacterium]|nr:hypothetical protein [Bacteroidaceae bacterium]